MQSKSALNETTDLATKIAARILQEFDVGEDFGGFGDEPPYFEAIENQECLINVILEVLNANA